MTGKMPSDQLVRWTKKAPGVYRYHDEFVNAWVIQLNANKWEFSTTKSRKTVWATADTMTHVMQLAEVIMLQRFKRNIRLLEG